MTIEIEEASSHEALPRLRITEPSIIVLLYNSGIGIHLIENPTIDEFDSSSNRVRINPKDNHMSFQEAARNGNEVCGQQWLEEDGNSKWIRCSFMTQMGTRLISATVTTSQSFLSHPAQVKPRTVHMCNKRASRHVRVGLANPSDVPRCDICEICTCFPGEKPQPDDLHSQPMHPEETKKEQNQPTKVTAEEKRQNRLVFSSSNVTN
ncbi:hypothetical protein NC652_018300 [Populus alba x Populus x berolinensis]|nr:hypothetical protein NC652_018300 [Populus alba x Populus x berolinensis]